MAVDPVRSPAGCETYDLFWTTSRNDPWHRAMNDIGVEAGLVRQSRLSLTASGTGEVDGSATNPYRSADSTRTDLYRIHLRASVLRVSAKATKTTKAPDRRPYRSKLREQQAAATRRAVVDAARGLFVANGWAATGMREVAAAAGVAVETVYSHFSSKRGLLQAVLDTAVVGDDAPEALAERDDFLAAGKGPRPERIRAAARLLTAIQVRTASVNVLLRQAAPADEEVAEMLRTTRENQRIDHATGFELVNGRAPSRTERDGSWAIASPEVYLLLVEESGWSPEEYEAWIAELMERVIPARVTEGGMS